MPPEAEVLAALSYALVTGQVSFLPSVADCPALLQSPLQDLRQRT